MKNGNMILREGRRISFNLSMMDAAPKPPSNSVYLTDTTVTFNDAEQHLFDSAEGQCIIAQASSKHRLGTAFFGDRAPDFTDAQAAAAIKAFVAQSERGRAHLANMTATMMRSSSRQRRPARTKSPASMAGGADARGGSGVRQAADPGHRIPAGRARSLSTGVGRMSTPAADARHWALNSWKSLFCGRGGVRHSSARQTFSQLEVGTSHPPLGVLFGHAGGMQGRGRCRKIWPRRLHACPP